MAPHSRITFGKKLQRMDLGLFVLTETYHPPGFSIPKHSHEAANLNLTVTGSFRETMGSRANILQASSLLVKPAGESHANYYGPAGAACFVIEVRPTHLEPIVRQSKLFDRPDHLAGGELTACAKRIYREFKGHLPSAELMIEGLLSEMLAETSRRAVRQSRSSAVPSWLKRARDLIHSCYKSRLGLAELARTLDVNSTFLARSFRNQYGRSVGEYVRELQLRDAADRLARTQDPLIDIALEVGFYDQSHFSNAFRSYAGITPAEYRRINL